MIENNSSFLFSFPISTQNLFPVLLHWLRPPEQISMVAVIVASLLVPNFNRVILSISPLCMFSVGV